MGRAGRGSVRADHVCGVVPHCPGRGRRGRAARGVRSAHGGACVHAMALGVTLFYGGLYLGGAVRFGALSVRAPSDVGERVFLAGDGHCRLAFGVEHFNGDSVRLPFGCGDSRGGKLAPSSNGVGSLCQGRSVAAVAGGVVMVRVVAGRKGGGKSYCMVREMLLRRRVEPDRYWCTNFDIKQPFRDAMGDRLITLGYDDVATWWKFTPKGSSMYFDESTAHFDSRRWSDTFKKNPDLTNYLSHVRKFGDEVHIITHQPGMLDNRIRQYTDLYTWCLSTRAILRGLGADVKSWEAFRVSTFFDEAMSIKASVQWVLRRKWVLDAYDSYAVSTAGKVERLRVPEKGAAPVAAPADGEPVKKKSVSRLAWWAAGAAGAAWGMYS